MDAGQKAEDYFFTAAAGLDQELVDTFEKAGRPGPADEPGPVQPWLELAKGSSYKIFADEVPGGGKLIEEALAVQ